MKNILRVWKAVEAKSAELQNKKTPEMWQWVPLEEVEETGCMTSRVENSDDSEDADQPGEPEDDESSSFNVAISLAILSFSLF